jgi:hypothetical protein
MNRVAPMSFGDDATRDAWARRCDEQQRKQTVPFSVAPGMLIRLASGKILREGDEVRAEDLTPPPPQFMERFGTRAGAALLNSLADKGFVLESQDDGPAAA